MHQNVALYHDVTQSITSIAKNSDRQGQVQKLLLQNQAKTALESEGIGAFYTDLISSVSTCMPIEESSSVVYSLSSYWAI